MSNPNFVDLYSTYEIYWKGEHDVCFADELDGIIASIPDATDFAPVGHTHTGFAAEDHNHNANYAALNHTHTASVVTSHMGNNTYNVTSGDDYVNIPLTTSVIVGEGLTVVNNAVKIGTGVSKVRISAQVCVGTGNLGLKYLAIRKANGTVQLARAQMRLHEYTTPETMVIAPLVIEVSENDALTLDFYGASGDTIYGGVTLTYITVEKLA